MSYAELVDNIQKLSYEDKLRLEELLKKYLIDEKREQIYHESIETDNEVREGKIKFYDNAEDLEKSLED